ncbi:MAG TPA: hypothetical protein VGK30_02440 [Candidatus Binatia bacterium]|jgi:hypothetical protein
MRPSPIHRTSRRLIALAVPLALLVLALPAIAAPPVSYDIVYVRQPRFGANTNTTWPEVFHPARIDPGADLMLLHPDGSEELLVAGGNGAVTDPFLSFDAAWVYYAYFPDVRPQAYNSQRDLPYDGADIYRINLASRQIQQLTHGEFTPNTGAGTFDESDPVNPGSGFDYLGYGILNLGPCPLPGGKIAFTSNRNGFLPPKGYTNPTLQLFVMDEDGQNVTQIAPMNVSSALHPTPLRDGRLMYTSHESQGLRDTRLWGIWSIWPDGRHWSPIVSAFHDGQAFHFMTQLSNDDIVVVDYYNLNNNGFGALFVVPLDPPVGQPRFFPAFLDQNPSIDQTVGAGFSYPFRIPFTPRGMYALTPFTHPQDEAAPVGGGGQRVGKFTQPSAAPNNDLLVVWTPGPANNLSRPTSVPYDDAGLYLIPGSDVVHAPADLVEIKNDPQYNEAWPRAVVPYSAVHGDAAPAELPWLPNDGSEHADLIPAGTAYGLVGTSSLYKRESFPGIVNGGASYDGLDVFNTTENGQSGNWGTQGADDGRYTDYDLWAVRILAMEPGTHRSYGPHGGPSGGQLFYSHAMERLRILGEIPLRKFAPGGAPILDAEGNPDTSFLVKLPADTPFTFQTIDRNGLVLNMAQTWHQVRPGEARYDCGGCHAHSQQPLDFDTTYAASPAYTVYDLSKVTPLVTHDGGGQPALRTQAGLLDVEFYRDIRPLLQRSCVSCHGGASPAGNLALDDTSLGAGGLPGDYARLAEDTDATFGYPPVIGFPAWRQTNASRYVRRFQSRRSLLVWKIFGARLDGWTNADHPTESTPGNASTLPQGADPNDADLDYTGSAMPPPGANVPPLTIDERMLIARWIDLGAPINVGDDGATPYGWFLDEIRPTLALSLPRPGADPSPVDTIRVGVADAHGIAPGSLSVSADFVVAGRAPGAELADLAVPAGDGIVTIAIAPALTVEGEHHVRAHVADVQGNLTRVDRRFFVGEAPPPPPPAACPAAPAVGCGGARKSTVSLQAGTTARLGWTWTSAAALDGGDLGDPVGGGGAYRLCVYDGADALLAELAVPAGHLCNKRPCWKHTAGGFTFADSSGQNGGAVQLKLKPGAAGKGRLGVKAKGAHLVLPALPLASPAGMTVQLRRDDAPGTCWHASYPTARVNSAKQVAARVP